MTPTQRNPTSTNGHNWQQGPINSPTVLNSSMNIAQFWDGRAKDLETQAGGPIANPGEMAFTHELAIEMLQSIPGYVAEFKQVFKSDKIDIHAVTHAIAVFEEVLVTTLSVRSDDKGGKRLQRLEGAEFVRRFMQHVLPTGVKCIRHHGVLASSCTAKKLSAARLALQMPIINPQAVESVQAFMARVAKIDVGLCPCCKVG